MRIEVAVEKLRSRTFRLHVFDLCREGGRSRVVFIQRPTKLAPLAIPVSPHIFNGSFLSCPPHTLAMDSIRHRAASAVSMMAADLWMEHVVQGFPQGSPTSYLNIVRSSSERSLGIVPLMPRPEVAVLRVSGRSTGEDSSMLKP